MYIKVSEIHNIYIEDLGNPKWIPILFVHWWPWAGFNEMDKKFFNFEKNRVIFFDQRWTWKSLPFGELIDNNTFELVSDIEKIRKFLGIDKWIIFWGSWWTTLSLIYAINFPDRIISMILRWVFLWTQKELNWFVSKDWAANFYPESFDILNDFFENKIGKEIIKDYVDKLEWIDAKKYAKIWNDYEFSLARLEWYKKNNSENDINLALAKIETYYFINNLFIEEDYILNNISKIKNINISIIQWRYDILCPPLYAWKLHKELKNSTIKFILAWHSPYEENIFEELKNEVEKISFS